MYRWLYQHILSRFDAESMHDVTLAGLIAAGNFGLTYSLLKNVLAPQPQGMAIHTLGLTFDHPLGLAAGFDKDARCLHGVAALNFSFTEIGTVTPQPQPGNPRRRIFRLIEDAALINRMGFPSDGMLAVERSFRAVQKPHYPVGVSLGKNKMTPLTEAHHDYCAVLRCLYQYGDFFVVNISSPNTPDLRQLQAREYLDTLLAQLQNTIQTLAGNQPPKPLLIKLSPDMTWDEIDTAVEVALTHGISGIVATNTTIERSGLHSPQQRETGGLSGRPLQARSTEVIRHIYRHTQGKVCLIGVGGIFSGDDIWEKMCAGATLVQAYTGLIYEGPAFVKKTIGQLQERMRREGVATLSEITGSD